MEPKRPRGLWTFVLFFGLFDTTWGVPPPRMPVTTRNIYIFSRESQPKPSFVTGILGGGTTQDTTLIDDMCCFQTIPSQHGSGEVTRFEAQVSEAMAAMLETNN